MATSQYLTIGSLIGSSQMSYTSGDIPTALAADDTNYAWDNPSGAAAWAVCQWGGLSGDAVDITRIDVSLLMGKEDATARTAAARHYVNSTYYNSSYVSITQVLPSFGWYTWNNVTPGSGGSWNASWFKGSGSSSAGFGVVFNGSGSVHMYCDQVKVLAYYIPAQGGFTFPDGFGMWLAPLLGALGGLSTRDIVDMSRELLTRSRIRANEKEMREALYAL